MTRSELSHMTHMEVPPRVFDVTQTKHRQLRGIKEEMLTLDTTAVSALSGKLFAFLRVL